MSVWEVAIIDGLGLVLGAAIATASTMAVSKALANTWVPYITWQPLALIATVTVGLTLVGILVPTGWLLSARAKVSD